MKFKTAIVVTLTTLFLLACLGVQDNRPSEEMSRIFTV